MRLGLNICFCEVMVEFIVFVRLAFGHIPLPPGHNTNKNKLHNKFHANLTSSVPAISVQKVFGRMEREGRTNQATLASVKPCGVRNCHVNIYLRLFYCDICHNGFGARNKLSLTLTLCLLQPEKTQSERSSSERLPRRKLKTSPRNRAIGQTRETNEEDTRPRRK